MSSQIESLNAFCRKDDFLQLKTFQEKPVITDRS